VKIRDSCLCGSVRYEVQGPLTGAGPCTLPDVPEVVRRGLWNRGVHRAGAVPLDSRRRPCRALPFLPGEGSVFLPQVRLAAGRCARRSHLGGRAGLHRRRPHGSPPRTHLWHTRPHGTRFPTRFPSTGSGPRRRHHLATRPMRRCGSSKIDRLKLG